MGRYKPDQLDRVKIIAYVLAWWWNKRAGGPRPLVGKEDEEAPIVPLREPKRVIPDLRCPFCYHEYSPPKNYKTRRAIAYHWQRWLGKHFDSYHTDWRK
jgi:hypothetical protein